MIAITLAQGRHDLAAGLPLLRQLRSHLNDDDTSIALLERLQQQGTQFALLREGEAVRAVAGFRLGENLAWGRYLYVEDLVSDARQRSCGHGAALFRWLSRHATEQGCGQLHLDSGVQRFAAHRFYLRERMAISSHHFTLHLDNNEGG